MHRNNEFFGWFILALTLLALGLFLEQLKGESVKEMTSIDFTKPDTWVGAYQCECHVFKRQINEEVFWVIEGRVLYRGKKTWQVRVKTWRNAKAPDSVYLYMVKIVCNNWKYFIVSEYNKDVNRVNIADLKRGR